LIGRITKNTNQHQVLVKMIFIDFLKKRGKKKNKYGMLVQNFNRITNVAMEHNGSQINTVTEYGRKN
jgi:hypothetical protein